LPSANARNPIQLVSSCWRVGLPVQEKEDPHLTEWDRFARTEYVRLAMEEEGEEIEAEGSGSADVWESEAPF